MNKLPKERSFGWSRLPISRGLRGERGPGRGPEGGPAADHVSTSMQNMSLERVLANALKTSIPTMDIIIRLHNMYNSEERKEKKEKEKKKKKKK